MKPTRNRNTLLDNLLKRQRAAVPPRTPFVSVVCPTWNRREFLPYLLYIYQYQDYPADKRELIILDDSEQSNQDLIEMMVDSALHNVRYVHSPERLPLGRKRNMLNELALGEYIISFDDDDYYPPEKISHQVAEMQGHNALFSGCDQIYVWYSHLDKMYLSHRFGPHHALNGTFGVHLNLLKKNRYQDDIALGEERTFLNNFTTPVLQLAPEKSIVCISHSRNTYDKDFVMGSCIPVDLRLEDLVKDENLLAHDRRLSRAPLNQKVAWSVFHKVAVIYAPGQEAALEEQCRTLIDFGFSAGQLLPVALQRENDPALAELKTHCALLEQARQEGWHNLLLLDAAVHFVKKENSVQQVNALLTRLEHIDWQALMLGGKYRELRGMKSLSGVVRVRAAENGCAYAVHANFYSSLIAAYRQAIAGGQTRDEACQTLFEQSCWLGFYPSFAFIQQTLDRQTGQPVDCTHWFFRKHR